MRFAYFGPLVLLIAVGPAASEQPRKVPAARPDEPLAKTFSLEKGVEYLDAVTLSWVRSNECFSCHTGYPYVLARASVGDPKAPGLVEARKFLEERVAAWDKGGKGKGYLMGEGIIEKTEGVTEVVAIAATLALDDGRTTGKLRPATRTALARMWELQQADGSWTWNKENLAPLEHDDYYGAVYGALGVGHAPEGYARSAAAREGVARLVRYFEKTPAPDLHHKTYLLWASLGLDGLMSKAERERTVKALLALQREDGGWSLPSLGAWKRQNGKPQDEDAPSDGYATGLVVYVLRQAGVAATEKPIRRGVAWLKANQRESGRWFTRSLNRDGRHYVSNAGTAFAILALKSCE
ncbi:MAG TPA: prenyltransferase/squalene oxidase repeat-containing protein [Gemmataceae bacterium]|nr:prenyltransferase/squalene oxidase repeat-containing protein [Gemmataceae bacterium]